MGGKKIKGEKIPTDRCVPTSYQSGGDSVHTNDNWLQKHQPNIIWMRITLLHSSYKHDFRATTLSFTRFSTYSFPFSVITKPVVVVMLPRTRCPHLRLLQLYL
ncbi:hypothetical protein, unlikely [Trypanosoma brucei gambiense DAL972]|uniref:Uncharacterized protein n=1 Tax=Trypanosoma brucei gambiense (strain MHOM/CI/86/DAL972) TaxID=679716 RepID=C9ZUA2_TRYB9|nr:hypothetical protein, unlikely [Trypanosoma brucei gambiense DAL972]CBH12989.1 hypothetical protein, unlikely [Trypanosoma brucei gambiense DAL972]|eukprot:XP_011775267.1 hypothetical protein, unlikely [Trypanosoma brucei gambiense DAL972]